MKPRRLKILLRHALTAGALLVASGCERGMDALNTDRARLTAVEPIMQLNHAIVQSAPSNTMYQCELSIVKQQMRIFTGTGACGNFNVDVRDVSNTNWNNGYQARMRNLRDAVRNSQDLPAAENIRNMARIWAAFTFMRITDSYGDAPYTEAGLGHQGGNVFPAFDKQEFIYTSPGGILEEIANATAALNPSLPRATNEVLYSGDIAQWRRLGNSLLLRAGMRLTKVRPDLARQYVQRAVAGGLMQSNADNAVIRHNENFRSAPGESFNGGNSHFSYLVHDFVDHLQRTNDPRLAAIAVRYPGASSAGTQTEARAVRDPARQIGIPMGFDNTNIGPAVQAAGLNSLYEYSQIDRTRMVDPLAPHYLITYAQTQLLLAEAVHRGWVPGNAATHYVNAIRSHMQQISTGYRNTVIPTAAIDAYVAAHPLTPGRELEQINTQYWVVSFLIPDEAWANFRRSCYPQLTPNPRKDDLGPTENFMRRLGYPDEERSLNPNVASGVTPDLIGTRIWWDVRQSVSC